MDTPFPCPFCQSTGVKLLGSGGQFLHYRCSGCAEVWTAQRSVLASSRERAMVAKAPSEHNAPKSS